MPPQGSIPLTKDQLAAMRHIIYSQANKVFQFKMTPQGLRNLGKITEVYLQAQLDRQFSSRIFITGCGRLPSRCSNRCKSNRQQRYRNMMR